MLHLHDIESGYGAGQVLFGVSLSVPAGRVVSLMGRNGMGKTTTIRTIMGQLPLTAGRISRFGNDQPDQLPFQIARQGIGLVPEGRQIFSNLDDLTIFNQNICFIGQIMRDDRAVLDDCAHNNLPVYWYLRRGLWCNYGRLQNGMQQNICARSCPFLADVLGLIMAQTVDTRAHDHCRGRNPIDPTGVMTRA